MKEKIHENRIGRGKAVKLVCQQFVIFDAAHIVHDKHFPYRLSANDDLCQLYGQILKLPLSLEHER